MSHVPVAGATRARHAPAPPRLGTWQASAACTPADMHIMYGPDSETDRARAAREKEAVAICATCPVTAECLEDALTRDDRNGVWGGLTPLGRYLEELARAGVTLPSRCRRNHEYTPENTRWKGRSRSCRTCERDAETERRRRQVATRQARAAENNSEDSEDGEAA